MNLEKLTEKAQAAVSSAQDIGIRMGHQQLDGEHLHLALVAEEDGLISKLIGYMGGDIKLYVNDLENALERLPRVYGSGVSEMYATRRFNEILLHAEDEAKRFKDEYTSVEHIYIALLKEKNTPSAAIFARYGISLEKFMEALRKVRSNQRITSQNP